jgi:hypothetical protein
VHVHAFSWFVWMLLFAGFVLDNGIPNVVTRCQHNTFTLLTRTAVSSHINPDLHSVQILRVKARQARLPSWTLRF